MRFPVPSGRLPSDTMGDPRTGHRHIGQDIQARPGAPVFAAMGGRVVSTPRDLHRACGFGVIIDDEDGNRWTYCHLRAPASVSPGDHVDEGDLLGYVGATGNATYPDGSTHPHLHIQAVRNFGRGQPINLFRPLRAALGVSGTMTDYLFGTERPAASAQPTGTDVAGGAGIGAALVAFAGLVLWANKKGKRK